MSEDSYHGGHSLADLIYELLRLPLFSLREAQNLLAQMILDREIVLSEELPQGWYLEWASVREEGDGWVRLGGRRIMLVISGKRRDPKEFRYHKPPPPVRPKQIVEQEPLSPVVDPPAIAEQEPVPGATVSLPLGRAGHAGHSFAGILERWCRHCSIPLVQEYVAHLLAGGDLVLSEALPEGWWFVRDPQLNHSVVIAALDGSYHYPSEIHCIFPNDPRLAGPLQLSRLRKPAVETETTRESTDLSPGDCFSDEPDENKATKWIAWMLRKDPKLTKKGLQSECIRRFKITPNAYDKRAWPQAHVIAGLPMRENDAD